MVLARLFDHPFVRGSLVALLVLLLLAVAHREHRASQQRQLEQALNSLEPKPFVPDSSRFESMLAPSSRPVWTDREYCVQDGVNLTMDLYYPSTERARPSPVVIYVHGGGWTAGDKDWIVPEDVEALTRHGYVIVAINYRLAPQYPYAAAVQDIRCAVRSVKAQATAYGLDEDAVVLWGHSAGAHLAALAALSQDEHTFDIVGPYPEKTSTVRTLGLYAGPTDLQEREDFYGELGEVQIPLLFPDTLEEASPITYVSDGDPPVFIVHDKYDELISSDQAFALDSALRREGIGHEFVLSTYGGHGLRYGVPDRPAIAERMASFFDEALGR